MLKIVSLGILLSTVSMSFINLPSSSAYYIDTAEVQGAKTSTGDWTNPSSEITALNNGISATETTNSILELQIEATDNIDLAEIHIYTDTPSDTGNYSLFDSVNATGTSINQTFTLTNSLPEDGEYNLYAVTEDWYGNMEATPTNPDLTITYDSTAPTSTMTPTENSINYSNTDFTISIQTEDTVSNINSVQYKIEEFDDANDCSGSLTEITAYTDMTLISGLIGDSTVEAEDTLATTTYSDGCYLVTLKTENEFNLTSEKNFKLTFDTTAPTANAGPDYSIPSGGTVNFDGSGSSDNIDSDDKLYFEWDLDEDGTYEPTSTGMTQSQSYTTNTTVSLRVTDRTGNSATDTTEITIN